MCLIHGANQLNVDRERGAGRAHRAFNDDVHAQTACDRRDVLARALVMHGRRSGDHGQSIGRDCR
jgi:hypothetical protein